MERGKMKTQEVIKELEKMNLKAEIRGDSLLVFNSFGFAVASTSLSRKFETNTYFLNFRKVLSKDQREKVYFLLTKLAETEPEDREEPERFYLKFEALTDNGSGTYLNYYKTDDSIGMSTRYQSFGFQTEFTQKEIDEIKEKFGVTLSDFRQIPVDEYWEE
jgi:hypothetical protein